MVFKIGHIPHNFGKPCTKETKQKISISKRGKKITHSKQFKKGRKPWNKGLHINLNPNGGFKKGHGYVGGGFKKGKIF